MQSTDYEKVELYVSCRNLKNMDLFSKSDPQVKLYVLNNGKWNLIGATEVINDNLNPNFTRPFILDFVFEVQQHIKFEVIDIDGTTSFDYIGSIETTLGKIMGAKKQSLLETLHDTHGKAVGKIIVRGEKQSTSQNLICWQWSALKLMNTDGWFDKSDPFLKFFKRRDDGEWLQVHESEVIMDNLNPIWKTFEIKDDKLCGADHSKPIRVECWDWESNGKNQYIGDCQFTLDMLKNKQTEFELSNPKKKKKTGTLKLRTFSVIERPSFLEYIRGGEQLNIITAIDFTGSNGHPSRPESLHARNLNGQMNQYQKALTSVCQILLNYDYDQQIPVFGFGGKPHYPGMSSTVVAHCFPCSGNLNQTEVQGLDGILAVYDYALNNVELSGPTFFAPIIGEAMKLAQVHKQQETGVYTVLLILTDGEIHDMDQTIDAICAASHLPISIIIVGVGNADFGKMEILDGDQGLYSSRGQKAQRDLVQFVPFRNFNGDMVQLAQHVLAEVPDQLVEYMRLVGRKPRPPVMVDVNKLGFSSLATMGEQPQAVGQPGVQYGGGNAQAQPLAQNAYLMNAGMHNLVQSVTNNVMGGGFGAPVDPYTNYGGAGHQQQQQPQLAQNPYLMGAGMHDLVHAAVNSGTPVNQYGQQNVQLHSFETNMNHQQQQQQQQPTWMGQQGAVNLQSFGMTQSVNMNQQQMGYQNQQNTPTNQNLYPRYQI